MVEDSREDIGKRTQELIDKGFGEWLKEEVFFGMNLLEGEVSLDTKQYITFREKFSPLHTRIFLGRDISLPQTVEKQYSELYPESSTLFQTLFLDGFSLLMYGYLILNLSSFNLEEKASMHTALRQTNRDSPMTLFYVHGATFGNYFMFSPSDTSSYNVNTVLEKYKSDFFNNPENKPLVFINSCNTNISSNPFTWKYAKISATLKNPGFNLVYMKGFCGPLLFGEGRLIYDRGLH